MMKRLGRTEDLDVVLRSADPAVPYATSPSVDDALDSLGGAVMAVPRPEPQVQAKRAARGPATVVAGGLAVLLVGGGVATAAQYTTHTGFFTNDGLPHSEILQPDAPDFLPLARKLTKDIVFAPGDSAENYWWTFFNKPYAGTYTSYTDTGVGSNIADDASCSWQRAWLSARETGNTAGVAEASRRIHAAAASPFLRHNNNAKFTEHLIDAEDAGDPGPLLTHVKLNCAEPRPLAAP